MKKYMALLSTMVMQVAFADSHGLIEILNAARQNDSGYHGQQMSYEAERLGGKIKIRGMQPRVDLAINGDIATKTGKPKLTLTVPVYDTTKIIDQSIGKIDYDVAELKQRAYEQKYRIDVAKAYFNVLSKHAILDSQRAEHQRLDKSYQQTLEMHQADMKSEIDVLAAKANLDFSSVGVLEAQTALRHAKGSLRKMVNQPITKLKALSPGLAIKLSVDNAQAVFESAQKNNVDFLKKQQALKKAHAELEKAHGRFFPTVSLTLTASQDLGADVFDLENKTSGGTLGASINLYNGGKDHINAEQKALQAFSAEDALSNLLYDLGVNSSKVVSDFENAQARRLASEVAESSAVKALDAMYEKHLAGQASELELYTAITQASKAQKNHISASHQVILRYLDVAKLSGQMDDYHIMQVNQLLLDDVVFDEEDHLSSASDFAAKILSPHPSHHAELQTPSPHQYDHEESP